jgi:hypothetical protein
MWKSTSKQRRRFCSYLLNESGRNPNTASALEFALLWAHECSVSKPEIEAVEPI